MSEFQTPSNERTEHQQIQWGTFEGYNPEILPPDGFVVTPAGNFLSIVFAGTDLSRTLELTLGPVGEGKEQPLNTVRMAAIRIPVTLPPETFFVGYKTDIRGDIIKSKGARAVVVADVGGTTRVLEFPYGQEIGSPPSATDQTEQAPGNLKTLSKPFLHDMFSLQRTDSKDDEAEHPTVPSLIVTLHVSVERKSSMDHVHLFIDSLDLEAVFGLSHP
ncbi:MAG TPA: hypothetical protein VGB45_07385 [Abditibacterium sp.]|jgi:hypothetical protein